MRALLRELQHKCARVEHARDEVRRMAGKPTVSFEVRFWSKVEKTENGCWHWRGALRNGYGVINAGGHNGRTLYAHRVAYEALVGQIPAELQLDHLCRNRACCNPAHLEPVTQRENILRGTSVAARFAERTHCEKGHAFTGDNLVVRKTGQRECRECKNAAERERHARLAARV